MKGITSQFEELSVMSIDGGRAIQAVDYQLKKVIDNCLDVNTDPKTKRTVTLKITISPTADRTKAEITYEATPKFASDAAGADTLTFGRDQKGYVQNGQIDFQDWQATQEEVDPETGEVTTLPNRTVGDGTNGGKK